MVVFLIEYKTEKIESLIAFQYPDLLFFVKHECSRCQKKCLVPSLEMFRCLCDKIKSREGSEHGVNIIYKKDKPRSVLGNRKSSECMKVGRNNQIVFDVDVLSQQKKGGSSK